MAYIVGSASVEIVPDFRNAQLAITAWFAKQQNELRVPIKPDVSPESERVARQAGDRLGKAVSEATEKQMAAHRDRERRAQERLGEAMARDMAKATAKAIADRAKQQEKADADALRAQERLGAAMARDVERAIAERARAEERASAEIARIRQREWQEQQRLGAAMAREVERAIAERARAEQRANEEAARQRMTNFRNEERLFQEQLRMQIRAMQQAVKSASEEEKIRLQVEIDKKQAILDARTTGGVVARAIHQEIRQNAGLITAAVTGALTIGAGAVGAAAVGMFGAIGAAGAFQSDRLRSQWVGTFEEIRQAGIADTAVLIPAFERMAGAIGNSFERMRPQLQGIFQELPDQIDIFSDSLTRTAENTIPGFVSVIQNGRPIVSGFGDLMERTGQGISDLLGNVAEHAPAAGQSLAEFGNVMGQALPLVGQLIGQGAELGTVVLPALSGALGAANWAVESLGSSLPVLVTGFLAFRTVQGTGRFVNQFSQSLVNLAPNLGVFTERMTGSAAAGERVMTGTNRAAGAVSAFGRALPAVGVAVGLIAAVMADGKMELDNYAQALMQGGAAAAAARREIQETADNEDISTAWLPFTQSAEEAADKVRELEAAMSPLELAQSRLGYWTNELAYRMDNEAFSAEDVAIAQQKVAEYSARAADEQAKLERATRGVTEAMVAQADQARARVDSEFAYQQSILDTQDAALKVTEAQTALNEARAGGNASEIAAAELALKQALLDSNTALSDQVAAAQERAMSNLPAALDEEQRAILGSKAALDELNAILAMGIPLPPELEAYRLQLERIVGEADGVMLAQAQMVAAFGEVGLAVSAIPGTKAVKIEAPTDEIITRLKDLGFQVTELPDGSVEVRAVTEEAKGNLGELSTLLTDVDGTTATPEVIVQGTGEAQAQAQNTTRELQILGGQRPTPVVDMNGDPYTGKHRGIMDSITNLAGQRPTPTIDATDGPFQGVAAAVMREIGVVAQQRPNPTITATDWASGVARSVKGAIDAIRDKTVVITAINRAVNEVRNGFGQIIGNEGGAIEDLPMRRSMHPVYKFDMGGAVVGRGSAKDDLVSAFGPNPFAQYRIANGEHILDGLDVALLGGQAGVYAFRDMLKAGAFQTPQQDTGIRQMVSTSSGHRASNTAQPAAVVPPRSYAIYTPDIPAAMREIRALEHEADVMASPWWS